MGLTERDIDHRVAKELAFKLRLERPLIIALRRLFKQMSKDLSAYYFASGRSLEAEEYKSEILGLLKPVYRKASVEMSNVLRTNIKAYIGNIERKQDAEISNAVREFVNTQPEERAQLITDTNQKAINMAIMTAVTGFALEGIDPSQEDIAGQAGKEFLDSNMHRAQLIAETEVLNAVEGSKYTELATILSLGLVVEGIRVNDRVRREWVAVLDNKTRESHVRADGQRVDGAFTPFEVGSSRMRYPGDTSLGAPVREIINCRCGAHTMLLPDQPSAEQVSFR